MVSLEDGHSRTLVDGAHFGRYLSSGHLAYLRHGTLFVRAFDAARQELTGPEIPLLQGVEYSTLNGAGQFDIAANGTLIYRAARAGSELKTVQWMDRTGRLEPLLGTPGDYRAISLSGDGKRLAMVIGDAGAQRSLCLRYRASSAACAFDRRSQYPSRVEGRGGLPGTPMGAISSLLPAALRGGFPPRDFRNPASSSRPIGLDDFA